MDTMGLVLQGILAFVFLLAGAMKLVQTRDKVMASGGRWAEDFSSNTIKLIGLGEVLCAFGVIVPHLLELDLDATITIVAAVGIAFFMMGAFYTHLRRKEYPFLVVTSVFFLLAVGVIWIRSPLGVA